MLVLNEVKAFYAYFRYVNVGYIKIMTYEIMAFYFTFCENSVASSHVLFVCLTINLTRQTPQVAELYPQANERCLTQVNDATS